MNPPDIDPNSPNYFAAPEDEPGHTHSKMIAYGQSGDPLPQYALSFGVFGATTTPTYTTQVTGDTNPEFAIAANGALSWGPGNTAADTILSRAGVGALQIGSPAGSAGVLNVGATGVYAYASSSRYLRFDASGGYNDFRSAGETLAINYGGATGEDVIFFGTGADQQVGIGGIAFNARPGAQLGVVNNDSSNPVLQLTAASGQSSSMMVALNQYGGAACGLEADGIFKWFSGNQTTVGAAGSASSLPSQPTTYLEVHTPVGLMVIPAYAQS